MTRRRCITCKGEKRVTGTPSAVEKYPSLVPGVPLEEVRLREPDGRLYEVMAIRLEYWLDMKQSIILCPDCKGSGFQFKAPGGSVWLPWPQEHIRI